MKPLEPVKPVRIANEGSAVVFDSSGGPGTAGRCYLFSSAEVCSDGSVIVCGVEKERKTAVRGRMRVRRSYDGLKSFTDMPAPTSFDEAQYPDFACLNCHITETAPGTLLAVYLFVHADDSLPLFHPETDGIQPAEVRISRSLDNGASWSRPRGLDCRLPDVIIPGKPVRCPDGTVGFPCEVHHEWDRGFREGPSARFVRLREGGGNRDELSLIVQEGGVIYGDARLTLDSQGNLAAFFWKLDTVHAKDLPVHRSLSYDSGRTWELPRPTGLVSQITSPLLIRRGLMLGITQDRMSTPSAIRAMVSLDDGLSWEPEPASIVFAGRCPPKDGEAFKSFEEYQFGYSWLLGTADRSALAVYWHEHGSGTSISITRLRVNEA